MAGECVKLLQDRFNFERGDCSGTSDETLLAVAGLAVFEVSRLTTILSLTDTWQYLRRHCRMVQTHMAGMKRILDLRGGLNSIRKSNPLIANIVFL